MRTQVLKLTIVLVVLFAASGCWDRKELNELGIVLAMAVDKDDDRGYLISCQVVVPSEVASNSGKSTTTTVTLVQAAAPTIHEALYKMTLSSPRISYMSHIRLLVFSEEIARQGIAETLEALLRDPNFRPDYFITIARGSSAEDILTILTPLESIPANSLFYSLKNSSDSWAPTIAAFADDTVEKMVSSGVEPVLTGVRIQGDRIAGGSKDNLAHIKPEANLLFTGMAVLKRDRMIGWMDENESKGYNYIVGEVKETSGHMSCPEGEGMISMVVLRSDSTITPEYHNDEPAFNVKIKVVQTIYGDSCETSLSSEHAIRQLEKISERKLIKLMEDAIQAAQKRFKSDIFGFGRQFYHKYPMQWKLLSHNWNEKFTTVKINVEVESQVRRIGTLDESIIKQMKEDIPE